MWKGLVVGRAGHSAGSERSRRAITWAARGVPRKGTVRPGCAQTWGRQGLDGEGTRLSQGEAGEQLLVGGGWAHRQVLTSLHFWGRGLSRGVGVPHSPLLIAQDGEQRFPRLWSCQAEVGQSPSSASSTPCLLSHSKAVPGCSSALKVRERSLLKPLAHYQAAREAGGATKKEAGLRLGRGHGKPGQ